MRIHEDHNGLYVNAITKLADGSDVDGHHYDVIAGKHIATLQFQNGPVQTNGVNGLTNEAMLAILIHRTGVLNSKFPCRENSLAITNMEQALMWLEKRTRDRISRSVEGQDKA